MGFLPHGICDIDPPGSMSVMSLGAGVPRRIGGLRPAGGALSAVRGLRGC